MRNVRWKLKKLRQCEGHPSPPSLPTPPSPPFPPSPSSREQVFTELDNNCGHFFSALQYNTDTAVGSLARATGIRCCWHLYVTPCNNGYRYNLMSESNKCNISCLLANEYTYEIECISQLSYISRMWNETSKIKQYKPLK